jgi:hypothetical protein
MARYQPYPCGCYYKWQCPSYTCKCDKCCKINWDHLFTRPVNANGFNLFDLAEPKLPTSAATKSYTDTNTASNPLTAICSLNFTGPSPPSSRTMLIEKVGDFSLGWNSNGPDTISTQIPGIYSYNATFLIPDIGIQLTNNSIPGKMVGNIQYTILFTKSNGSKIFGTAIQHLKVKLAAGGSSSVINTSTPNSISNFLIDLRDSSLTTIKIAYQFQVTTLENVSQYTVTSNKDFQSSLSAHIIQPVESIPFSSPTN